MRFLINYSAPYQGSAAGSILGAAGACVAWPESDETVNKKQIKVWTFVDYPALWQGIDAGNRGGAAGSTHRIAWRKSGRRADKTNQQAWALRVNSSALWQGSAAGSTEDAADSAVV